MPGTVQLLPLVCFKCQTAIPAGVDEVAWVCPTCGQGLLLSAEQGTCPLDVHFAAGIQPGTPGRPFWVGRGLVETRRRTFGGSDQSGQAEVFWHGGRNFYVPAFTCPLEQLIEIGTQLVIKQPALQQGAPAAFVPVTTRPEDVRPYAEFIVMAIEAGRPDRLKDLQFTIQLDEPVLWVVP